MKILQVIPHLSKGGAERVVIELSNALVSLGHEVTILSAFPTNEEMMSPKLSEQVKRIFVFQKQSSLPILYFGLLLWITQNFRSLLKYRVVHCHLTFGLIFGIVCSIPLRLSSKFPRSCGGKHRLVATCHLVGMKITLIQKYINIGSVLFFDRFVLIGEDSFWSNLQSRRRKNPFPVIRNGISFSDRKPQQKKLEAKEIRKWKIGTISRLHPERVPWKFIEVFFEIQKNSAYQFEFLIGGEGKSKVEMMKFANQLGIAHLCTFTGLVSNADDFIEDLDLYISLNIGNFSGVAAIEAVFNSKPVVGIQIDQNFQPSNSDFIWSHKSTIEVANYIKALLEDDTARVEIQAKQLIYASNELTSISMAQSYLEVYTR